MEQILKSLLHAENLPQRTKYALIHRIKSAGVGQASDVVISVLNLTSEWYLNEINEFPQTVGLDIYKHWAKAHPELLIDYMSREKLVSLLTESFTNSENIPLFIHYNLELMTASPHKDTLLNVVKAMAINFVKVHVNLNCLKNFVFLLHKHRECVPDGKFARNFCVVLTQSLSILELPTDHKEIVRAVLNVKAVSDLIFHIWTISDNLAIIETLKEIFSIISTTDELIEPTFYLGALIKHVPIEMTDIIVKMAVDSTERDENMVAALTRMIGWLRWPGSTKLDQWVILFFKTLACKKRYSVLISATEKNILQVFEKILFPNVREAAINILSHMLLSFQHSPEPFHTVLSSAPGVIKKLEEEKSSSSISCLNQLIQLLNCLMFHFAGYPEVYEPIIELIKQYPSPSKESIQALLSANKWTAQSKDYKTGFKQMVKKLETGKTGLCNLGNTCYMNSVLQTLYMCDEFRKKVLNRKPLPSEICLVKLQHVFAFLMLSERPSYAASKFLKVSKPAWFTDGQQQDCSEFLKYFLDQLKEQSQQNMPQNKVTKMTSEETPRNNITAKVFEGELKTIYKCSKCQTESSVLEAFNDLTISFPEEVAAYSNSSGIKTRSAKQPELHTVEDVSQLQLHLNDLITGYFLAEELCDENQYHCAKCDGLQDGVRSIEIEHSPEYLILTLLRFSYSKSLSTRTKILNEVVYPKLILLPVKEPICDNSNSLLKSVINNLKCDTKTKSSEQYDIYCLCSVIMHSGSSSHHGHYYCYARHSLPLKLNIIEDLVSNSPGAGGLDFFQDKWFLFNDSHVTNASYSNFSNITKRFSKDTPYVLCYRRIRTSLLEESDVDLNTSVDIAEMHQPVRQDLLTAVSKDNAQYLQEQELAARAEQKQAKNSFMGSSYDWQDPDDDRQPPGSCGGGGGGGLGGMDMSGARFIF